MLTVFYLGSWCGQAVSTTGTPSPSSLLLGSIKLWLL